MATKYKKERQFKTLWHHKRMAYWFRRDRERPDGFREKPEVIRFDVAPGVTPSGKAPVRIFMGTEPRQYRAERVFVWAVQQVRDPSRVYEIYLMKDLKGFDRSGWKTGFTNYRYAIPALAGGTGRAIFNDVDQIYLGDPAELFDMDMGDAAMLGITERETSVMLLDCEKMIKYWKLEDAQHGKKHADFRDITHGNKLWAKLPGVWNARDEEFEAGESKCFHFTTLQTQPWQPFPDQLKYQPHPDGEVWFSLERAADKARFTQFTRERPSQRFPQFAEMHRRTHNEGAAASGTNALAGHEDAIARLISETGAKSVLDYGSASGSASHPKWPGASVTCLGGAGAPFDGPIEGSFDGVISAGVLDGVPDDDVGFVLDEMFAAAGKFVHVAVACDPDGKLIRVGDDLPLLLQSPEWWKLQLEMAARRNPGVRWVLTTAEHDSPGKRETFSGAGKLGEAA